MSADIMLLDRGANLNIFGTDGLTPLHHASRQNWVSVAAHLVDLGFNREAIYSNGQTALLVTAMNSFVEAAQPLRDGGTDVDFIDSQAWTSWYQVLDQGRRSLFCFYSRRQ